MSFDKITAVTTYIIVSGSSDTCVATSKSRLEEMFPPKGQTASRPLGGTDPFFLHTIIAQESLLQSKSVITNLRYRLYDGLDAVDNQDKSAELAKNRSALKGVTNKLHLVSQDADQLVASTEMATMVAERMFAAHDTLKGGSETSRRHVFAAVDDSLSHLVHSLHARKRWLQSYQSRKDIAMNLVSLEYPPYPLPSSSAPSEKDTTNPKLT